MKLYDSMGPNPRVVRMFMAEKGIELPKQPVDLRVGLHEDRRVGSDLNPPTEVLRELADNIIALGERLHVLRVDHDHGTFEIDLRDLHVVGDDLLHNGFRFGEGLKFFQKRIPCAPEASPGLKMIAANRLQWLDGQMGDKDYLCGKRFTLADILLYCWLDFGGQVGQPLDPANTKIAAWFARVGERSSAKA